jgi:hypothetical protein
MDNYLKVIDLRWGIEGSGKKSNLAFEFCLNEVERCKNDSAGPNFIVKPIKFSVFLLNYNVKYLNLIIKPGNFERTIWSSKSSNSN